MQLHFFGESEHKPSLLDSLTQVDIATLRAQIKKAEEQGQPYDLAKAIVKIKLEKEQAGENQPAEKSPKVN